MMSSAKTAFISFKVDYRTCFSEVLCILSISYFITKVAHQRFGNINAVASPVDDFLLAFEPSVFIACFTVCCKILGLNQEVYVSCMTRCQFCKLVLNQTMS